MAIDPVLALSADQISSNFLLLFPRGIPGGGNADLLSFRMDQAFDHPEYSLYKYDVFYQGNKITKTSTPVDTATEFPLTFRIDQGWLTYTALENWINLSYNRNTQIGGDELSTRVPMVYQALGANKLPVYTRTYSYVKLASLQIASSDPASGDPQRVTGNFIFYSF